MFEDHIKAHLHDHLRRAREALLWKLDGVAEYDARRPLTTTGTNLLGLVKHTATWDARYFGEVFERPFGPNLPRWDDQEFRGRDLWVAEDESRTEILAFCQRVHEHADATIRSLPLDAQGYVPWWDEQVPLFNVMLHCLSETTRHAGHADILREGIDGQIGVDPTSRPIRTAEFYVEHCEKVERAAQTVRDR